MFARKWDIESNLQVPEGSFSSTQQKYWTLSPEALLQHWSSSANGLSTKEAEARLRTYGSTRLAKLSGGVIATSSEADAGVVVERMRAGKGSFGFDAGAGRYVELFEVGLGCKRPAAGRGDFD